MQKHIGMHDEERERAEHEKPAHGVIARSVNSEAIQKQWKPPDCFPLCLRLAIAMAAPIKKSGFNRA
jgi:hypothetical protein